LGVCFRLKCKEKDHSMNRLLTIVAFLLVSSSLLATHHITYFVFVETHFVQGYWKDAPMTYQHQGAFLYPHQYTDLMGTVKREFYQKLLGRLGEHHDFYTHVKLDSNTLHRSGHREYYDTLNIAIDKSLSEKDLRTVKNELTATVLSAGETRAVRLNHYSSGQLVRDEVLDYSDLDYPVFDLTNMEETSARKERPTGGRVRDTIYRTRVDTVWADGHRDRRGDQEILRSCWDRYLWLGIIVVLLIFLFRNRMGKA